MVLRKWFVVVTVGLLFSLIATGCGSSGESQDADTRVEFPAESAGDAAYDMAEMDVADESAAVSDRGAPSAIGASVIDRRVIRSGELSLIVSDVPAAVRYVRELVPDYDGYVESSATRTFGDNEERADLTLEVPSHRFDEVINALRNGPHVVRVDHESTSSQDVTEEFVDLTAQLSNLEATEMRFVELLDEAHSIDEILRVESELSRIRGDIERIQGRLNYLEQRTDYSRITVAFSPETEDDVLIGGQPFTPGESAQNAWNASLEFVGAVGNAIITVAVFFWWAWPLVAILAVIGIQFRRKRREREVAAA